MVKFNVFKKTKYVLYCKQEKEWSPVLENDKPITFAEAKAMYGDECDQLRLEEQTAEGKRLKMVWVEPPRKKKAESVTPLDLLANYKVALSAVADIIRDTVEVARAVNLPQQTQSSDKDLEFLKLILQAKNNIPIPQPPPQQQSQPPQLTEADLTKVKEWLEKDEMDAENAPCKKNPEKCLESEGEE